jgi:glycosyltransferase involved in cell wall biosynthesis
MRVLVVSSDVVGPRMAGPAIRSWEFSRLLSRDHDVVLAAPPPLPAEAPGFALIEARRSKVGRAVRNADVVLIQGTALHVFPGIARAGRPLVVDFYGPYVLENLEAHSALGTGARRAMHQHDLGTMMKQARLGDLFLCASERQRYYWLGLLTAAGRINPLTYDGDPTLERLIAIVPFGLPDRLIDREPRPIADLAPDDRLLLWWGGIWNWLDPITLLRALKDVVKAHPEVRLFFMGARHPNPAVAPMRRTADAIELARNLGLLDRNAFFKPWSGYEEREAYLARASVGLSLHLPHLETMFAFRTRVLDYLWAGLPMLVTRGDSMADLVEREGLGVTVEPEDVQAVRDGLLKLLEDEAFAKAASEAALQVSERFRWSVAARPLLDFCAAPRRSPDAGKRPVRAASRVAMATKAWHSLRDEGGRHFLTRSYHYVRKRLT